MLFRSFEVTVPSVVIGRLGPLLSWDFGQIRFQLSYGGMNYNWTAVSLTVLVLEDNVATFNLIGLLDDQFKQPALVSEALVKE